MKMKDGTSINIVNPVGLIRRVKRRIRHYEQDAGSCIRQFT
ncbi:hypothetical protein HMPREF9347_01258 [Escherichia coli MS 124-1]|nr:hypothetical protein HMPREF9536_04274 [Escherichia coli MS 84-1]EFK17360.1 hypothetical protein HMPREF9541_00228 [Escherichia coli MS 116-1]EFK44951.1 hypothetical protein HMPREF9346_03417 [Escherichia coli MS 119-7]EFK69659.1 hypothetical protein HMPREF9347_01258 [Escherichia coli MS 124-1]EFO57741.1 hypothetical protein HMPREF9348_03033 [Escherichia coli MS 145-7]